MQENAKVYFIDFQYYDGGRALNTYSPQTLIMVPTVSDLSAQLVHAYNNIFANTDTRLVSNLTYFTSSIYITIQVAFSVAPFLFWKMLLTISYSTFAEVLCLFKRHLRSLFS